MSEILSVSQFVEVTNWALEALETLTVEGEVGEFKIIHNKWVTFALKDKDSSVNCFMTVWQYRTQIEDGMIVRATGQPKLRPKGFFSFVVDTVQPAGEGALRRAFLLLQKKLAEEGLFASERKRALPKFPQHIALLTSRDAAAYNDFLKVVGARMGGLTISFIHTQVQGLEAPDQICAALEVANTELKNLDAIVVVRGGGSLEDLHAFNDEAVVRAVAASRTPTIVGIGHERDLSLAELAADVRASTPSNAAELLIPSRQETSAAIRHMQTRVTIALSQTLTASRTGATGATARLKHQIAVSTGTLHTTLSRQRTTLHQAVDARLQARRDHLTDITRLLRTLSPVTTLARGYSVTRTRDGKLVRHPQDVKSGQVLVTQLATGSIDSTVTASRTAKKPVY